ncbi:hypothetical protein M431DRAFT_444739 [Trichoderma harzianum CBS 226.95]|uniref:Uncharacterized protein n=1 Tax=Trichoderma harzianum CBS 226.95 TaxID=983964 RepID=A0A2T4AA81_TRIHA|nr:hypothetical protein M431DRAFT_444739 [Trichoderma harzianum CBS 226.95]PTB53828.1 hypothetical protein M431DRAFT_444739 [Trichoderma harzianum CBS 226.95]
MKGGIDINKFNRQHLLQSLCSCCPWLSSILSTHQHPDYCTNQHQVSPLQWREWHSALHSAYQSLLNVGPCH